MRKHGFVLAAACSGALLVSGMLLLRYRVELFVLPAQFQKVLRLEELYQNAEPEQGRELRAQLDRAASTLIQLQRPGFEGGFNFSVRPVMTLEGDEASVITWRGFERPLAEEREILDAGLHYLVADQRGRVVGEDFQVPPWPNSICAWQNDQKLEQASGSGDILVVSGDVAYALSVDADGIVPRGAILQTIWPSADASGLRISSGISLGVRRWLESLQKSLASPTEIASLLNSSRLGDAFRALHEIERTGPSATAFARILLGHEDPDVRARAAAVCGNDASLFADLAPLLSDPVPEVRKAAAFARLRAADVAVARGTFLELLHERSHELKHLDFDYVRLLSTEAAAELLDWLELENDDAPEHILQSLRPEDLRPFVPRIEALWNRSRTGNSSADEMQKLLIVWMVQMGEPRLSRLLLEVIEAECPDEDFLGNSLADKILSELLERRTPLEGPGAVETVRRSAECAVRAKRGLFAYAVLLRWRIPGAGEGLLSRLLEPENDWLFDPEWEYAPLPRNLFPAIESLATRDPPRYKARIQQLAEQASSQAAQERQN